MCLYMPYNKIKILSWFNTKMVYHVFSGVSCFVMIRISSRLFWTLIVKTGGSPSTLIARLLCNAHRETKGNIKVGMLSSWDPAQKTPNVWLDRGNGSEVTFFYRIARRLEPKIQNVILCTRINANWLPPSLFLCNSSYKVWAYWILLNAHIWKESAEIKHAVIVLQKVWSATEISPKKTTNKRSRSCQTKKYIINSEVNKIPEEINFDTSILFKSNC